MQSRGSWQGPTWTGQPPSLYRTSMYRPVACWVRPGVIRAANTPISGFRGANPGSSPGSRTPSPSKLSSLVGGGISGCTKRKDAHHRQAQPAARGCHRCYRTYCQQSRLCTCARCRPCPVRGVTPRLAQASQCLHRQKSPHSIQEEVRGPLRPCLWHEPGMPCTWLTSCCW